MHYKEIETEDLRVGDCVTYFYSTSRAFSVNRGTVTKITRKTVVFNNLTIKKKSLISSIRWFKNIN